jgi:hypothetical protein
MLWVVAAPGSANVLAGTATLLPTSERGTSASRSDVALKGVLTAAARNRDRYPVSLAGQYALIADRLRGTSGNTALYLPDPIRQALLARREQTLEAVRSRSWPMLLEAQTRAEIEAAVRLVEECRVRGILVNSRQTEGTEDLLRSSNLAVVIGPTRPTDAEHAVTGLVRLIQRGVPAALGGDGSEIRTTAAVLAAAGLPRASARKTLIAADLDSLAPAPAASRFAPGSPADLVIWSGDPLDLTARPLAVIVEGKRVAGTTP